MFHSETDELNSNIKHEPLFGSNLSSQSKNFSHRSLLSQGESNESAKETQCESPSVDSVRSKPSFQVGKRFFSTKPHRMAQFEKEFNIIGRSASANSHQTAPEINLMAHSVTESLLSRSNLFNNDSNQEQNNHEQKQKLTQSPISSSINARIFSISPLDSLVISAINQLSLKLRNRMVDFLEKERSNHSPNSEPRILIDEILPQVNSATNQANVSKSHNYESSNISRDLSNILKNLKKVDQTFDGNYCFLSNSKFIHFIFQVFYMLCEPNATNPDENLEKNKKIIANPIITNVSDSDSSGGESVQRSKSLIEPFDQTFEMNSKTFAPKRTSNSLSTRTSPSSSIASSENRSRSEFFIEI